MQPLRIDVPEPLILLGFFVLCAGWFRMTGHRAGTIAFFRWLHGTGLFGQRQAKTLE